MYGHVPASSRLASVIAFLSFRLTLGNDSAAAISRSKHCCSLTNMRHLRILTGRFDSLGRISHSYGGLAFFFKRPISVLTGNPTCLASSDIDRTFPSGHVIIRQVDLLFVLTALVVHRQLLGV